MVSSPKTKVLYRGLFHVNQYLASIAITLFGLMAITFFIGRMLPVDPVLAAIGDQSSQDAYEAARIQMGLHLPLYQQFGIYVSCILQGDFGQSFLTNNDVLSDICRVFPATIELATLALLISVSLGIPLGIIAALYRNRWPDQCVRALSLMGNSFSIFWIALMGLLIFYYWLDISSGPGRITPYYLDYNDFHGFLLFETARQGDWAAFCDAIGHIWLPACILAYYKLALISRMTRAILLEQLQQEYVLTARAKGLPYYRIILVHAMSNTAIPLLTVIGLSYALALEGSTFIETIFLWPGLGHYLIQALRNADMNAILGCTLVIGAIYIVINLITDILYYYLDPRLRTVWQSS